MERIRGIYERQVGRAYRTAMIFMKNPADAEDVTQSVFLAMIEKDIQFASEDHEKAWIITATRNRCKDILKSSRRSEQELDETALSGEERMAFCPPETDEKEAAVRILMSLPEQQREIVFLHFYEGYKVSEVAEITGLKATQVRSGITSARRKLNAVREENRSDERQE